MNVVNTHTNRSADQIGRYRERLAGSGMRRSGWRWRVLAHFAHRSDALTNPELFDIMVGGGEPIQRPTLLRVLRDLEGGGLLRCEMKGGVRAYRRDF